MRSNAVRLLPLLLVVVLGCGGAKSRGGGGGGGDDDAGVPLGPGLRIEPADPELGVDGKGGQTLAFRVFQDGQDVTGSATLLVADGRLGGFAGATFTAAPGGAGRTTVRATVGNQVAMTSLTLRLAAVVLAPGAPPDAPARFGGADDPARAPALSYPPDGVLVPPNLSVLEVHFTAKSNDLFEVSFVGDTLDLRIYTPCTPVAGGCALLPDEDTWRFLANAGRGGTLQVKVRGTSGAGVGTSAATRLSFADDDMEGGLYYWAASSGGLYRYDFGRRGQTAEPFYTPGQAGALCVGCHTLSRNGRRIAVGLNAPTPSAGLRVLDVATKMSRFDLGTPFGGGSNYQAFTPDGSRILTTETTGLTIHDADTGQVVGVSPSLNDANMPDVSPDGANVVFARDSCGFPFCINLSTMKASLLTVPFTGTGFGQPKPLVPSAGDNNYYPSYSPDGQLVVFNRSRDTSYDAPDARVMAVSVATGTVVDLAAVNDPDGNSWPKWAPFIHRFQGSTVFWVAFSSRRPYGLREGSTAQIWMAAVDAGKVSAGTDGSFPAFWLPFQDPGTGNHIPQFVEAVERQPCVPTTIDPSGGCEMGEICENGVCVPGIM